MILERAPVRFPMEPHAARTRIPARKVERNRSLSTRSPPITDCSSRKIPRTARIPSMFKSFRIWKFQITSFLLQPVASISGTVDRYVLKGTIRRLKHPAIRQSTPKRYQKIFPAISLCWNRPNRTRIRPAARAEPTVKHQSRP